MLIYQLGLHFIVFQAWWWSRMFYSSQQSGRHVHRWHVGKSPDVNGLAQTISPQNICMWIWTHQIIIPTTTTSSGSVIIMILILIIVIIKFKAFFCRTTLSHSLPVVSPVNFMAQKNGPTWIYQHQIWSIGNKLCCFCWHSNFEPPFSQHLSTRTRFTSDPTDLLQTQPTSKPPVKWLSFASCPSAFHDTTSAQHSIRAALANASLGRYAAVESHSWHQPKVVDEMDESEIKSLVSCKQQNTNWS